MGLDKPTGRSETQRRARRRNIAVLSWSTALAAIAGFFVAWHEMSLGTGIQSGKNATNTITQDTPSPSQAGQTGQRQHHRGSDATTSGSSGTQSAGSDSASTPDSGVGQLPSSSSTGDGGGAWVNPDGSAPDVTSGGS